MPEPTASDFLNAAAQHMDDRATTYDSPQGERSMGRTVAAFNAITGHAITEEQGWLFMETLKLVRSQQGDYRADNYEDAVAYAGLRGEAAARERQAPDEQQSSTCPLCGDEVAAGQEEAHAKWRCPGSNAPAGQIGCIHCGADIAAGKPHSAACLLHPNASVLAWAGGSGRS